VESSCELGNEPSGSIKMLGNYREAEQLVSSRVVLGCTELVSSNISHLKPGHVILRSTHMRF
jgi:hypothetical protein